jgi:hypothetical protein
MKQKDLGKAAVPNGHGSKYRRKDFEAVGALITEPTVQAAAEKVGVSEKTLWRWLRIPEFRKKLEDERLHRIHVRFQGLDQAVPSAVQRLWAIVEQGWDVKDRDYIAASKALLDAGLKELQIYQVERRLNALEQKLAAAGGAGSVDDSEWGPDPALDVTVAEALRLVTVGGTVHPGPSDPNQGEPASAPPAPAEGGGAEQRVTRIIRRPKG